MAKSFKWKNVRYTNERGSKLAGLLYAGLKYGTVVIVCHGFTGSKEGSGKAIAMAEELGRRSYATLLFDFSGCGESEGDFANISLTGHISDIKSSVDFCLSLGFNRVITIGRSFGGTAALCHGGMDKRVAGVCTWAALADTVKFFSGFQDKSYETEKELVLLSGEGRNLYIKKSFFSDLETYDVLVYSAMLASRPLLIIHGSNDTVVPAENAYMLFNAAREPKRIRIIPGADHQFTQHYLEAWETVFDWLKENFPV